MYSQLIFTLIIVVANTNYNLVHAGIDDPPVPVWPNTFQEAFEEIIDRPEVGKGTVKGVYYYDYEHRAGRVDRATGKYDFLCSSITHTEDVPCTDLTVDGFRYLVFPTMKNCCMCCTTEQGCGILAPNWLSNATFIGYNTTDSVKYQVWDKKGFQHNYYWQVDATQVPYIIDQQPDDKFVFNVSTFSKTVDPSAFVLPSYCSKDHKCSTSACNF